jgi:hypothetical protein
MDGRGAGVQGRSLSASVQWRSPASTSAVSTIRAWSRFAAAARPVFSRLNTCSRSSGWSQTTDLTINVLLDGIIPVRRTENRDLVN